MRPTDFTAVDRLMQEGVDGGVFPGAVVAAAKDGQMAYHRAFGRCDLSTGEPTTEDTLFDLASLTKPLVTALCTMTLVEDGRLRPGDRMGDLLPSFDDSDKADITVEHLLRHTSGLPDYRPYFEVLVDRPAGARSSHLLQLLLQEGCITGPGRKTRYSDIGFLLLQQVVEKAAGQHLDRLARRRIFMPLGLSSLHFPGLTPPFAVERYASTEICPWRRRVLRGEVHDENAWVLGGVAGHAGLFGTAEDVCRLVQVLCDRLNGDFPDAPFSSEAVRLFLSDPPPPLRALGFDVPDPASPSCGTLFSKRSIGHLGFTGTSFWLDLDSSLIVVLLTNRIHPSRENRKIREFRPCLHDAFVSALR